MSTNQEALPQKRIPADVFLSYASEDRERALWLRDKLLEAGVDNVWVDRTNIEPGEFWERKIDDGLRDATMLIALLTESSVAPSRKVIAYEQREAKRLFKTIIPLRYDAPPPEHLAHIQWIDFADEIAGLSKLLGVIKKHTLRCTSRTRLHAELPLDLDVFVGRETELKELFELIFGSDSNVKTTRQTIAIQGMGGQGKTMLAVELVRRIAARYPGGVLFVERGEVERGDGENEAPQRMNAEAVLQEWAKLTPDYQPSKIYKSADVRSLLAGYGELLVLIDDVSESDFKVTEELLKSLPSDATRLLTTRSRNIESVGGCLMYQLPRLNDDDAAELVRSRLLAKIGARSAPADSSIQAEAVRKLVNLVDGHGLALELACARCSFPENLPHEVDRLATSLAKGVDSLAVDLADGVTKDHSVLVSLNVSLEHLLEHDKKRNTNWAERFAALGVFPDGSRMTRDLIAAVWGDAKDDDLTERALRGLFKLAMIKEEPGNQIYRSHPLLRAFARSLLLKKPDRLAATQVLYRDFLTQTAAQRFREPEVQWSQMEIYTPHLLQTAAELWNECELLLGDLNALAGPEPAATTALLSPSERANVSRAADFAKAVMPYVLRRPALGETGRRLLILGLACVRAAGTEELMDTFVRALGVWYARRDTQKAEQYFLQALRWAEETGDLAEQGKILREYGELERNRTNFNHAIELLNSALAIHRKLDDPRMLAVTLKSLGEAYSRRCDFDIAMGHYSEAREIYQRLADRSGEADLLNKVGSLEFNRGDYKKAISSFRKALPMHREVANRSMEGEDLNDMGISWNYLQRPKRALPLLEKAIEIHNQLGNRRLEAIAISNRASAYYALGPQDPGAYETAVIDAQKSVAIAREIEDRLTEVWSLNWEGLAQQKLHRPELALAALEKADGMLGPDRSRECVSTWGNLGYLLGKDLGQRERGAELLEKAITLMRDLMRDASFTRAFGGRTLAESEAMLREIQS